MYIATIPNRTSPPAILLRQSYRDGSKVKTRTVANLTHWPAERIHALRRCLEGEFDGRGEATAPVSDRIFAVLFVLKEVAHTVGLVQALGKERLAKLALLLVLARVAHQGSRLSTVRWAEEHAVAEVLGLAPFDEDDLYAALEWVAAHQEPLEKTLYRAYVQRVGQPPVLVLYDVSSSYFEGLQNELAEYGYNRDGKRGKKQIVLGLLTAADGEPLAVRVFQGNTTDCTTVATQIEIVKKRFRVTEVVFVGDRGMVKANGKTALTTAGLKYITALTDPQVRKLLKKQVIPLDLFDEIAQEVDYGELRLVLRRNDAVRRKEAHRRQDKLGKLQRLLEERNALVAQSTRAKPEAGLGPLNRWAQRHKLSAFVTITLQGTQLSLTIDEAKQADVALLEGCYVLETDVAKDKMDARTVEERYRDLQKVERDFRTMKTALLEVRPIFVRKKSRTCGHVFVALLALKLARALEGRLNTTFGTTAQGDGALTLQDALQALSRLCFQRHEIDGQTFLTLPRADQKQERILNALKVRLPSINQWKPATV